jgi:hypothetical protein
MSNCPTLGFCSSTDLSAVCTDPTKGSQFGNPPPVFNSQAIAVGTVHNQSWPGDPPPASTSARTGSVKFYWHKLSLGVTDTVLTPDPTMGDTNPAQVWGDGADGEAGVPFGGSGTARMYWIANAANLGLSGPVTGVIGRLLGVAQTDALPGACDSVDPTDPSPPYPQPYQMMSPTYCIRVPTGAQAQLFRRMGVPHDQPHPFSLLLAFGLGNPDKIRRRARLVARSISQPVRRGMAKRELGIDFISPKELRLAVSANGVPPTSIHAGIVPRPVVEGPLTSEPLEIDLLAGESRQALLEIPFPSPEYPAYCMIEVRQELLEGDHTRSSGQFVLGLRNDPEAPLWY